VTLTYSFAVRVSRSASYFALVGILNVVILLGYAWVGERLASYKLDASLSRGQDQALFLEWSQRQM
jgi:hypothetical protein